MKKKNKKSLILLASALVMTFALTSCGGPDLNSQDDIYGISREDIQSNMQSAAQTLSQMSAEDAKAQAKKYEDAAFLATGTDKTNDTMNQTIFENWADNADIVGDLEGFGDLKVEKAGKTVTATMDLDYSKRDGELVYTFQIIGDRMKLTSMNLNANYTLQETMGKAAMNVVMGMVVVFAILIIISLVIYAFRIIPYLQKKFSKNTEEPETKAPAAVPVQEEKTDDGALVAVIAAAIAASTGTSTDDFVVRSIRRRY